MSQLGGFCCWVGCFNFFIEIGLQGPFFWLVYNEFDFGWRIDLRFTQPNMKDLIGPLLESLGYELWGIELLNQGAGIKFRIFIEKESGVDVEDCVLVSNHVSDLLDLEGIVSESYSLEVSSPGLDRILFDEAQYRKYVEHLVEVNLLRLFDGQRNFVGLLKGVEEGCLVLQIEEQEYLFPIEEIRKVRLVPVFE